MMLHIARSRPFAFFFSTYRIDARLEVSPEEHQAIRAHRLDKFEIFHDPYRDHLAAQAEAARGRVKALPWFSKTPEADALLTVRETGRELAFLIRARFAFRITVGNLIAGVSITNRGLNDIAKIEHVLHESVDAIAGTVAAALAYEHGDQDVLAPSRPEDDVTPPNKWPASW